MKSEARLSAVEPDWMWKANASLEQGRRQTLEASEVLIITLGLAEA